MYLLYFFPSFDPEAERINYGTAGDLFHEKYGDSGHEIWGNGHDTVIYCNVDSDENDGGWWGVVKDGDMVMKSITEVL